MSRVLGGAELLADLGEGGWIGIVAVDISEQSGELLPGVGVEASMLCQRILGAGLELVEIPASLRNTDDGDVEMSPLDHGLKCREDFFVGEVPGGAEEDKSVGVGNGRRDGFDVGQRRLLCMSPSVFGETVWLGPKVPGSIE